MEFQKPKRIQTLGKALQEEKVIPEIHELIGYPSDIPQFSKLGAQRLGAN